MSDSDDEFGSASGWNNHSNASDRSRRTELTDGTQRNNNVSHGSYRPSAPLALACFLFRNAGATPLLPLIQSLLQARVDLNRLAHRRCLGLVGHTVPNNGAGAILSNTRNL